MEVFMDLVAHLSFEKFELLSKVLNIKNCDHITWRFSTSDSGYKMI